MVALNGTRVLMFGGRCDDSFFDDVWSLDVPTKTWTLLDPAGGAEGWHGGGRHGHSMIALNNTHVIVLGGYTKSLGNSWGTYDMSIYLMDVSTTKWTLVANQKEGDEPVWDVGGGGGLFARSLSTAPACWHLVWWLDMLNGCVATSCGRWMCPQVIVPCAGRGSAR